MGAQGAEVAHIRSCTLYTEDKMSRYDWRIHATDALIDTCTAEF